MLRRESKTKVRQARSGARLPFKGGGRFRSRAAKAVRKEVGAGVQSGGAQKCAAVAIFFEFMISLFGLVQAHCFS